MIPLLTEEILRTALGDITLETAADGLVLRLTPDQLTTTLTQLRDDPSLAFKMLIDISAVDYPSRVERFEMAYQLLSLTHNFRLRIKVALKEGDSIPSAFGIFSTASWFEREVWDMFGIEFSAHPDLRRILTDYGFEGHPLRKDFPLSGYVEVRYDSEKQSVVYEPVHLTQAFRNFDALTPWEGTEYLKNNTQ